MALFHKVAEVLPQILRKAGAFTPRKTMTVKEIEELLREYSRIQEKKSTLSRMERDKVVKTIKFLFDNGHLQLVPQEPVKNEVTNVAPIETGSPRLNPPGPAKSKRGRPAKRVGFIGPATETFPTIEALAKKASEEPSAVQVIESKPTRKPRKVKED
jgi:hypothetical protein